ncbi:MAG: hypothetical protein WDN27_02395 [Candidatus Saccharibacteria bacterium]
MVNETKHERFKRLAKQRGDRLLKDIHLLGNLSNSNNYQYTDQDVATVFSLIESELRTQKARFKSKRRKEINF